MSIQESNNITVSDIEIKVEKFEEPLFNSPSAQIISKESPTDENFSLNGLTFVEHETVVVKTEEDDTLHELTESKFNEREIKDEYFDEPESIVLEDIVIKTEDQEEDQSNSKYFDPDFKTFTCTYCFTGLSTEKYKNDHERRCKFRKNEQNLGGSVFECSYCKLLHRREEDKNRHQAVCKKRKVSKKYKQSTTKRDEKKFCCYKCTYETQRKADLVGHVRTHDKINAPKHSCNQCPYQTIYNSDLKKHLRTHNCFGLICILCQKSFNGKKCLDAHYVSRHPDRSDEWGSMITRKINECPKCPYKTVITSHFKNHLATHGTPEDQARFRCTVCEYKCISKSNFNNHLRLHVGQLPFVCTECGNRFNRKVVLDGHIMSRHSENKQLISSITSKIHQCDNCNFKTVQKTHLKSHLKTCL